MQSTFQASETGQAIVQNATAAGIEQLIVSVNPGDSTAHIQIKDDGSSGGVVSSVISVNQANLQKLVDWLREQGVVD